MTDEELMVIELRCSKATKGPWKSLIEDRDHESGNSFIMTGIKDGEDIWGNERGEDIYIQGGTIDDQEFIAHARQDIPRLLEEIRKLKKIVESI